MTQSTIRVLAINGGKPESGVASSLIECVLGVLRTQGIETERIELAGMHLHDCSGCHQCSIQKDGRCAQNDDMGNLMIEKMAQSDGILFAAPTHDSDVAPELQALMERACRVAKANDQMFRRKVGAAIVSMHRAGAIHAFDSINHFFLMNEMIVPGAMFWNAGADPASAGMDAESAKAMTALAQNVAWLLKGMKRSEEVPDLEEILAP